jgi:hypothetical protein
LQPRAQVPLQQTGSGDAGHVQMLFSWFVASKSDWYLGFEVALIDALGQKHFEVQASPSQTAVQSVSAVHVVT